MATKTVINCLEHNMAQTNKGISIIIDPQAGYDKTMNTTNIIQIKHSNEQQQQYTTTTATTAKTTTTLLTLNDNIIGNGKTNTNTSKTLIDIKTPNDCEDVALNDHFSLGNHEVKQQQHILQIDCCNSNTQISPIAKEILESNHEVKLTEHQRGNEQHLQQHHHNDDVNISIKEHLKLANNEEKENGKNDEADGELNKNSQLKQQFNLTMATKEEEDDDEESGQTASQQQPQQQKHKEKEHYEAVQQSCFEQVEENDNTNGNSNSKTRENGQSRSINEITKQKLLLTDYNQNESHSDDNEEQDNNARNNNEHIHREGNHNNDGDHNETNCMDSSGGSSSSSSGNCISIGSDCITQVKREVADDFSHGKRSLYEENSNSLLTQADALTTTNTTKSSKTLLTINTAPLSFNFKQNIQENSTEKKKNNHVVKIQIKPNNNSLTEKQITVVKIENPQKSESIESINNNNNTNSASENIENEQKKLEKANDEAVNMVQKPSNNSANAATVTVTNTTLNLNVSNTPTSNANGNANVNGNGNGNLMASSTTVTELNVSNPQYLYYMMSSGQFSPCDTLDSGTGSDLESNGQQNQDSNSMQMKKSSCSSSSSSSSTTSTNSLAPLEIQLKNAKARLGNGKNNNNNNSNLEIQQRQCSFTDSEESEASSLSCDSLHSNEFLRQSSTSPTPLKNSNSSNNSKKIKSLLPDSLLREIKNLKFSSTDYEAENEAEDDDPKVSPEPADYIKSHEFIQSRKNLSNLPLNISSSLKRASLPSKTFVLNTEDGTFIDTKMNSMPRTYEADKYYNFHVNEHDNFRSFGSNSANGSDSFSISDFETKSLHDDVFAGYRDIRCASNTSTIRSSKGTVRGVKNRVRNGIATFLQLQQPNIKNYKEKDSGKVVLYTTSMGIIRDTYAKCSNVKKILRTLLVKFEERDVFMSVEYQQEIKERMHSDIIKVPQLYVEGQHIGDADTVERLNETGELRQLLKPYKSISTTYTCQTCGGYRLLPCPSCNGSKKSVHRNHFTAEFVALKCMNCDEVGLVKCHNC